MYVIRVYRPTRVQARLGTLEIEIGEWTTNCVILVLVCVYVCVHVAYWYCADYEYLA